MSDVEDNGETDTIVEEPENEEGIAFPFFIISLVLVTQVVPPGNY
jgi:hypothetical protein